MKLLLKNSSGSSSRLDIIQTQSVMGSMAKTDPQPAPTPSSSDNKPNVFQRLWQKLDTKMQEKAQASSGGCCCCEDDKSGKKTDDKCC